jgi:hypothetical protein
MPVTFTFWSNLYFLKESSMKVKWLGIGYISWFGCWLGCDLDMTRILCRFSNFLNKFHLTFEHIGQVLPLSHPTAVAIWQLPPPSLWKQVRWNFIFRSSSWNPNNAFFNVISRKQKIMWKSSPVKWFLIQN